MCLNSLRKINSPNLKNFWFCNNVHNEDNNKINEASRLTEMPMKNINEISVEFMVADTQCFDLSWIVKVEGLSLKKLEKFRVQRINQ